MKKGVLVICFMLLLSCRGFSANTSFTNQGTVRAYGDSITVGSGASPSSSSFINQIASTTGLSITNNGINAAMVIDNLYGLYNTTIGSSDQSIWLTGYNDMRHYGDNSTGMLTYKNGLRAGLVWSAIPQSRKIYASNQAWSYTGNWASVSPYGLIEGKYSGTDGDTASITVYGSAIYIGYVTFPNVASQLEVTVDGVNYDAIDGGVGLTSVIAPSYWGSVVRIGNLIDGPHEVVLTVNRNRSNAYLDYIATNEKSQDVNNPRVFAGNTLRMNEAGYEAGMGWEYGSDLIVAEYNAINKLVCDELASDGLDVVYVNASNNYNPNKDEVYQDNQHPNNAGHSNIAKAFITKMNQWVSPKEK